MLKVGVVLFAQLRIVTSFVKPKKTKLPFFFSFSKLLPTVGHCLPTTLGAEKGKPETRE